MNSEYKCQICGKTATRHYIETANGTTSEKHYCASCYNSAATGGLDKLGGIYGMNDMVTSIFGGKPRAIERLCDCGMTEHELVNGHKFGCEKCFDTFADVAAVMIDKYGGGVYKDQPIKHSATPSVKGGDEHFASHCGELSEMDKLIDQLNIAIKEERYADCDIIKKKIDRLRASAKKE